MYKIFLNGAVYEIVWINMVEPGRPYDMTHAHCMLHNCCYTHTHTHTHTEYVMRIAFPLQQWLHERASMLRYTYVTSWLPLASSYFCA